MNENDQFFISFVHIKFRKIFLLFDEGLCSCGPVFELNNKEEIFFSSKALIGSSAVSYGIDRAWFLRMTGKIFHHSPFHHPQTSMLGNHVLPFQS